MQPKTGSFSVLHLDVVWAEQSSSNWGKEPSTLMRLSTVGSLRPFWSLTDHQDFNAVLGDRRDPKLSQDGWTYFWSDKKRSTLHNRWLCPLRSISFREIVYAITFGERWYIWIRLWWIGCTIFLRLKHDKKKGERHQDMDLIRSSPNHMICHWYEKAASLVWLDLLIIYTPFAYPHGKIQVIGWWIDDLTRLQSLVEL